MSDDLLDEMKEFVQRNEGRATIKIVASPRQPKTEESGPRLVSADFGKYGGAFCITVQQPDGSLVVEKAGDIGAEVGNTLHRAAIIGIDEISSLPTDPEEWKKWIDKLNAVMTIRFIESMNALEKENKNMYNEIRVEDMVEVPGNRRGKVLEINNTAVVDVQVPGGANEIWPIEKLRKIPAENRRERGRHTRDAILKAELVMDRGEERFEITGWDKVLREEELPKAYTDGGYPRFSLEYGSNGPRISLHSEKIIIGAKGFSFGHKPTPHVYEIEIGDLYTPEAFGGLLAELKKAGERLMEINRDIKLREAKWVGPEKVYPI